MSSTTEIRVPEPHERDAEADRIIKRHMGLAMAGGAIPIPWIDLTAVTGVQLDMLKQLASTYSVEFEASSAKAFVTSATAALTGMTAARVGASVFKLLPGIGSLAGGAAQVLLTGASTYAIGNAFKRRFRDGRPLDELSAAAAKEELLDYFAAGREAASELLGQLRAKVTGGSKNPQSSSREENERDDQ